MNPTRSRTRCDATFQRSAKRFDTGYIFLHERPVHEETHGTSSEPATSRPRNDPVAELTNVGASPHESKRPQSLTRSRIGNRERQPLIVCGPSPLAFEPFTP